MNGVSAIINVSEQSPVRDRRPNLPTLKELGMDLIHLSLRQKVWALAVPLLCVFAYFFCAFQGWWLPAIISLVYFSFVSYGSISHDLVHRNLGLPTWLNETFLSIIELLAFRSGHAYRASHLNHHARFPHEDDVEGRAARMSFSRALVEGIRFHFLIVIWAIQHSSRHRMLIAFESATATALLVSCLVSASATPVFAAYAILLIAGSWILPIATVVIPHDAAGSGVLFQTRLFRGKVLSIIALQHLYHLEHHLYPQVPHQNWPKLAKRLDPFFKRSGVHEIRLWF